MVGVLVDDTFVHWKKEAFSSLIKLQENELK